MNFTVSIGATDGDNKYEFTVDDSNIVNFINSSENPIEQLKALVQNGYIMSQCIAPSMISCSCCKQIDYLTNCLLPVTEQFNSGNSSKSGKLCEIIMGELFKKSFPGIEYEDTAGIDRNGDAIINYKGNKIMIDYKNYTQVIPTTEVEKLIRDLKFRDIPMGIIYSTQTKVSKKDIIDFEVTEGKLLVFMCGEGLSQNGLIMAIKFIVHLYESNVVSISDRICELVNKTTGTKLRSMYKKILDIKDRMVRHGERITEANEKINKMMNGLKEDVIHMTSGILELVGQIEELVEDSHRETDVVETPMAELIDIIKRATDKKKDITQSIEFLNVAFELGIQCGSTDNKTIILFKDGKDIGKLKITKSNATVIVRNTNRGRVMIDTTHEELKTTGFHLTLLDSVDRWNAIKYRLTN